MPGESTNNEQTRILLEQWHAGERPALDALLARDLSWIRDQVRHRIGKLLGTKADVDDYVQDAMVKVLQYGPRFVMSDKDEFRALMARIIENTLRNHAKALKRGRRDPSKERPIASDSILYLDPPKAEVTRPSMVVDRNQRRELLRLAIDLLPPEDGELVRMRDWEAASFGDIATALGLTEDAARMRYQRILPRLARQVESLQRGDVQHALAESQRP